MGKLFDDEPEVEKPRIQVKQKEAGYVIMVRFRDEEDHDEFVDLIGQPWLKAQCNEKRKVRSITFPMPTETESPLSSMLF